MNTHFAFSVMQLNYLELPKKIRKLVYHFVYKISGGRAGKEYDIPGLNVPALYCLFASIKRDMAYTHMYDKEVTKNKLLHKKSHSFTKLKSSKFSSRKWEVIERYNAGISYSIKEGTENLKINPPQSSRGGITFADHKSKSFLKLTLPSFWSQKLKTYGY